MMDLSSNVPATSLAYQISAQKIQFQSIACALTNREWTLRCRPRPQPHACDPVESRPGPSCAAARQSRCRGSGAGLATAASRGALARQSGRRGIPAGGSEEILANTMGNSGQSIALAAVADRMLALPIVSDSAHHDLDHSFSAIDREIARLEHGSSTVVAAHIVLIMVALWRTSGLEEIAIRSRGASSSVLQKFRYLVRTAFPRSLADRKYADALAVSPDRLHSICVRELKRPPLKLIHERVVREAMLLLEKSMLTIEQISRPSQIQGPPPTSTGSSNPIPIFRRALSGAKCVTSRRIATPASSITPTPTGLKRSLPFKPSRTPA